MKSIIVPSILSCDFSNLAADCKRILDAGGDALHIDIMDGHFVPNLTLGPPIVKCLRRSLKDTTFDCHLMVSEPQKWIHPLCAAGASIFTFHFEAVHKDDISELISNIKASGMKAGIAIKPTTPTSDITPYVSKVDMVLVMSVEPGFGGQQFQHSALTKIAEIRAISKDVDIEVDGGITLENIKLVVDAGANVIVAGSSIFNAKDPKAVITEMKSHFNQ